MRYYETIYIVNPNLDNNTLNKIMNEIEEELKKTKSKVINHYNWGKKRLAYLIDNQKYGSYIILHFEGGDKKKMVDFDTWIKLNNAIIRHMRLVLDDKPSIYVEEKKEDLNNKEKDNIEKDENNQNENVSDDIKKRKKEVE